MKDPITISVTGAAGQLAYALLFRLASGAVFGPDQPINLRLLEIEPALSALEGVVMELDDCAFPLLREIVATADENEAFKDAAWAILIGAVPRKAGMERSDLLEINAKVFAAQGRAIGAHGAPGVKTFVIGNPCNTNALLAHANSGGLPAENFFAMTRLDENRAKTQLAQKAGVDVTSVTNLCIWGNHSATQYPDFTNAKIDGRPATDVISDRDWLEGEFISTVQQRGAAIIKARGVSSAASAANAAVDSLVSLLTPTPEGDWHSVAVCSDGSYGTDEGLFVSMPIRTRADGSWEIVQGLPLDDFSRAKIDTTVNELRDERETVKPLMP